jgi:AcrR family transcriptional regulator
MIVSEGYGAFTIAKLASQAGVTIPTIHNLVGNKSEVFKTLVEEMVIRIDEALVQESVSDPIKASEIFISRLIELFSMDENFYRAAFVVGEQEKMFEHENSEGIFKKSLNVAHRICEEAIANGYLKGEIDSWLLADKLFVNQRLARHDWVHGYISLKEYREQVLTGMCITFASDAAPDFHKELVNYINGLTNRKDSV